MEDFNVFLRDFENSLDNLDQVLKCCVQSNLTLNWEN